MNHILKKLTQQTIDWRQIKRFQHNHYLRIIRNTIVVGLKERKQKARNIILEADKQIKEAALEFPDSASKTRFLAAVDKAKDNLLTALEDITDIPP